MEITILHNQSFMDVAIQHTGSVENAFEIARQNNLSISDLSITGIKLKVQDIKIDTDFVNYLRLKPATGDLDILIEVNPLGGVGYWEIETEFEII